MLADGTCHAVALWSDCTLPPPGEGWQPPPVTTATGRSWQTLDPELDPTRDALCSLQLVEDKGKAMVKSDCDKGQGQSQGVRLRQLGAEEGQGQGERLQQLAAEESAPAAPAATACCLAEVVSEEGPSELDVGARCPPAIPTLGRGQGRGLSSGPGSQAHRQQLWWLPEALVLHAGDRLTLRLGLCGDRWSVQLSQQVVEGCRDDDKVRQEPPLVRCGTVGAGGHHHVGKVWVHGATLDWA